MIVAYVSGHGYGHATRTGEVLRAIREQAPEAPLAVVTSGPERLYRQAVPGPFVFRALECDVGVAQKDALAIDEPGTAARWRAFAGRREALVEQEARWLRASGTRLVLGDVPPLAFTHATNSPSVLSRRGSLTSESEPSGRPTLRSGSRSDSVA